MEKMICENDGQWISTGSLGVYVLILCTYLIIPNLDRLVIGTRFLL